MKIYTGGGDKGKTSLFSGERVLKSDERIEAYGDVDELNSILGALEAALPRGHTELSAEIQQIQGDLLHLGAWLATVAGSPYTASLVEIEVDSIQRLECAIDRMEEQLKPLTQFILPGGHAAAAWAHVARAVCRRAERRVVFLAQSVKSEHRIERSDRIVVYLNRLSDYLFVLARYCNHLHGIPDLTWRA